MADSFENLYQPDQLICVLDPDDVTFHSIDASCWLESHVTSGSVILVLTSGNAVICTSFPHEEVVENDEGHNTFPLTQEHLEVVEERYKAHGTHFTGTVFAHMFVYAPPADATGKRAVKPIHALGRAIEDGLKKMDSKIGIRGTYADCISDDEPSRGKVLVRLYDSVPRIFHEDDEVTVCLWDKVDGTYVAVNMDEKVVCTQTDPPLDVWIHVEGSKMSIRWDGSEFEERDLH